MTENLFLFFLWFALGALTCWVLCTGWRGMAALNVQLDAMPSTRWCTLPGNVLALGDTGFEIRIEPGQHKGHPFVLYTPEGVAVSAVANGSLTKLQLKAEAMARERDAFRVVA
jgi:hypothetical protein